MGLQNLTRTGLLFEASYHVLESLHQEENWTAAKNRLYEEGLASSKIRAYEFMNEIKKRLSRNYAFLPEIQILQKLPATNLNVKAKKEILFVYLYYYDDVFAKLVNDLAELSKNLAFSPLITRTDIFNLFKDELKAIHLKANTKTMENWLGRFIHILGEVEFLIKRKHNTYLISLSVIQPDTWNFFTLYCHFHGGALQDSPLFQIFNLQEDSLDQFFTFTNNKRLTYSLKKDEAQVYHIEIKTTYHNFLEWIEDKK